MRVLLCFEVNNFKFNFLSRGQLESSGLDKFLALSKIITCDDFFLDTDLAPRSLQRRFEQFSYVLTSKKRHRTETPVIRYP